MKKEFVTYEQALVLKELGYNEKCLGYYFFKNHERIGNYTELKITDDYVPLIGYGSERCKAPLKQQVFRWFREKHECYANLSSWIHEEELGIYHEFEIYKVKQYSHGSIRFKTYEEAENACIDKLIEIAKELKS